MGMSKYAEEPTINVAPKKASVLDNLPDIETVSAKIHEAWIDSKLRKGVTTRISETGEELMVPYDSLSEAAKDLDRGTAKAVYAAIAAAAGEEV